MDSAQVPSLSAPGATPVIENSYQNYTTGSGAYWPFTATSGNVLVLFIFRRAGTDFATPSGWTLLEDTYDTSPACDRLKAFVKVSNGTENNMVLSFGADFVVAEVSGVGLDGLVSNQNSGTTTSITTGSVTPVSGQPAIIFGAHNLFGDNLFGGPRTNTPGASWTQLYDADTDANITGAPHCGVNYRIVGSTSGSYNPACTAVSVGGPCSDKWSGVTVALLSDPGALTWVDAPSTIDADDGTGSDVDDLAIGGASGAFWRGDAGAVDPQEWRALIGFDDPGSVTVELWAGDDADFSDQAFAFARTVTATGGFTGDEFALSFDATGHRYWSMVLDTSAQDLTVYEVGLTAAVVPPAVEPAKAILEIYVHDEDASRWGTATWATGPATGDEGIWSAAGWQDITPEGVNAHIIWGSRAPERGILSEQNAGSWNVETYDPDRILDPGNFDSPYYPQLVAGVPIRISHDSLVIRTGYIDRIAYKYKNPNFRGQLLCTDTWALLNQAMVPADSILGNTLLERISDAINAAGVAVGGIPLPPAGPAGPTIADWEEGTALDNPTSVKAHIDRAAQEALWVVYVQADAGLGLRPWGEPLDRGREITAENLEDLESSSSEEGLYSVARVQVEDPDLDPIEREAAPLPRYGRRMIERTEPTVDPEGWAAAVLQDRSWPGVGYVPGTIHCFTAADVDYFGSLEIMERVTITVPGAVSVQGRILGGELWVEHRRNDAKGANWQFQFAIATDGSTAIGLTTLVADETGDTLVDDMTETDYLEAD